MINSQNFARVAAISALLAVDARGFSLAQERESSATAVPEAQADSADDAKPDTATKGDPGSLSSGSTPIETPSEEQKKAVSVSAEQSPVTPERLAPAPVAVPAASAPQLASPESEPQGVAVTPPAAAGAPVPAAAGSAATSAMLIKMIDAQQKQIDAQNNAIAEQAEKIEALKAQYQRETQKRDERIKQQDELIDQQRKDMQSIQARVDEVSDFDPSALSQDEIDLRNRLETLEQSIQQSQEAESTTFDPNSFPGSIPLAGTNAALRIGGFVKANYVQSFDTIGSNDRFIVGTIPTNPSLQGDTEAVLTVSQSRLNFDLRDQVKTDVLRAFIEADFAGSGDTFRLRHAFGQWRDFLIGKTWSVMVDLESLPEEIDFEGINGRILARQTQLRFFPEIGKDLNLILSLEDPQPDVSGGRGLSQTPDFVASIRSQSSDQRLHYKVATIIRHIEARWEQDDSETEDVFGWGLMVSGTYKLRLWDERDKIQAQLTYGEGHGRYVNDLGTLGGSSDEVGFDAIFSPEGELEAIPVVASYLSLQHWWSGAQRSNFIISYVRVDNFDFEPDDAYHQTYRATGNYIWSPTSRIDLGGELLWGQRVDKGGAKGDAWQLQLSAVYRF